MLARSKSTFSFFVALIDDASGINERYVSHEMTHNLVGSLKGANGIEGAINITVGCIFKVSQKFEKQKTTIPIRDQVIPVVPLLFCPCVIGYATYLECVACEFVF